MTDDDAIKRDARTYCGTNYWNGFGGPDYYVIDGVRHDAYLYIRYVNGAGPQKGWLELFARPLRAFFTLASSGWRKLLDGLSTDCDDDTNNNNSRSSGDNSSSKARDRERGVVRGSRASSLSTRAKDPGAATPAYVY